MKSYSTSRVQHSGMAIIIFEFSVMEMPGSSMMDSKNQDRETLDSHYLTLNQEDFHLVTFSRHLATTRV